MRTCGLVPTVSIPRTFGNGPSQKICNDETFPVFLTWSLVGHESLGDDGDDDGRDDTAVPRLLQSERAVQIERIF